MTPHVPDGYVLIPVPVFAVFVIIVVLACIIELALVYRDWANSGDWDG